jgi:hypothetical protein
MLGYGAVLGADHRRTPDPVEEGGLPMVHVTENGNDGGPDG